VLTHVPTLIEQQLQRGGFLDSEDDPGQGLEQAPIQVFPDLDRGLEWCEDEILAQ